MNKNFDKDSDLNSSSNNPNQKKPLDSSELFLDILERVDMGEGMPAEDIIEDTSEETSQKTIKRQPIGDGEYKVKQGECLPSIAYKTGHYWETIWNDPANTRVQEVRKDPYILLPDDRLHIPPLRPKFENGSTEQKHRFRRKGVPEKIHIRLLNINDEPLANVPYKALIDSDWKEGVTNKNGEVIISIPPNAISGKIIIDEIGEEIPLSFGALDPAEELSGIQARLNNLGFNAGLEDGKWSVQTEEAIMAFQTHYKLSVTGEIDDATRKKIMEVYGD